MKRYRDIKVDYGVNTEYMESFDQLDEDVEEDGMDSTSEEKTRIALFNEMAQMNETLENN